MTLDSKTLVVAQVQVQDVHFHRSHGIELPLDGLGPDPVAHDVDHQTPPGKTRRIANLQPWNAQPLSTRLNELPESLQGMQCAVGGAGVNDYRLVSDRESIGFVDPEARIRGPRRIDANS